MNIFHRIFYQRNLHHSWLVFFCRGIVHFVAGLIDFDGDDLKWKMKNFCCRNSGHLETNGISGRVFVSPFQLFWAILKYLTWFQRSWSLKSGKLKNFSIHWAENVNFHNFCFFKIKNNPSNPQSTPLEFQNHFICCLN